MAFMKAFAVSDRVKMLPVLVLCPVYDKKLEHAIVEAGFESTAELPLVERLFQKRVCKLMGIEPRGYISGLENDRVAFNFDEMLTRELKSAARGHYDLALLMLAISAVNEHERLPEDKSRSMAEIEHELAILLKSILKLYLRETDTVFLAGNNGIAIILPFADKEGARSVADKAKEFLENHSELSRLSKGFTMDSCFVQYPSDAKTRVKLMEHLKVFSTEHLKI
jgi:GGDEF domain-containing protein